MQIVFDWIFFSFIHFDEFPFKRRIISEIPIVGGNFARRWTWFAVPPIFINFPFSERMIPLKYGYNCFLISGLIKFWRIFVVNTIWNNKFVNVLAIRFSFVLPRPFRAQPVNYRDLGLKPQALSLCRFAAFLILQTPHLRDATVASGLLRNGLHTTVALSGASGPITDLRARQAESRGYRPGCQACPRPLNSAVMCNTVKFFSST